MASSPSARASTGRLWEAVRSLVIALAVILFGLAWATDGVKVDQDPVAGTLLVIAGVLLVAAAGLRIRRALRHRREAAPRAR